MEQFGKGFISPIYEKEDYINLNLHVNSEKWAWEKAIDIFKDRIKGRYFEAIEELIRDPNKNGFAIMAINCLLIETLCQFKEGFSSTPRGQNQMVYTNFLRREFPGIFDEEKANRFYKDIRCGILHSAQTKNGSQLTFGKNYVVEIFECRKIRVDVENLTKALQEYFLQYMHQLSCCSSVYIRENFIKKMRYICRYEL